MLFKVVLGIVAQPWWATYKISFAVIIAVIEHCEVTLFHIYILCI